MTTDDAKWSDFWVRLGSAVVLAPVALAALWLGGILWALLIGLTMIGLGWEWGRLTGAGGRSWLSFMLALGWSAAALLGLDAGLAMLAAMTLLAWAMYGRLAATGIPYAGVGGVCLLWLRLTPAQGLADTLFLVVVVWGTDIGAYLIGRLAGGRRLAPRISPGKTWSGSVGGLLVGAVCGAVLVAVWHGKIWLALPAGVLLSLCAQGGDLLESAIKRKLGVKDSGATIPGHGGLFDRLDGFLAAAPLAALLALGPGGMWSLWR